MSKNSNKLVDQSQALDSFFESLMSDVAAYEEQEHQEVSEKDTHQDINNLKDNNIRAVEPESINENTNHRIVEEEPEKLIPIVED